MSTNAGSVYTGVEFCKKLCGVSVIRRYVSFHLVLRFDFIHHDYMLFGGPLNTMEEP